MYSRIDQSEIYEAIMTEQLLEFLGASNHNKELINFLLSNQLITEPDLYIPLFDDENEPLDEDSLYISDEKKGICLLFRDEASCLDHLSDTPMLGKNLFFNTIFFYNQNVEEFNKYIEPLPKGLNFGMSKVEIHAILGNPDHINEDLYSEKWLNIDNEYSLYIKYSAHHNGIRYISTTTLNYKFL